VVSEVTLSFTTSNSIAYRLKRAGRKIEQSRGANAPHRFTDEVSLHVTIPASFAAGIIGTGHVQCSVVELQPLSRLVGFEPTTVGSEVTRAFTTPQTFDEFLATSLGPYFVPSFVYAHP